MSLAEQGETSGEWPVIVGHRRARAIPLQCTGIKPPPPTPFESPSEMNRAANLIIFALLVAVVGSFAIGIFGRRSKDSDRHSAASIPPSTDAEFQSAVANETRPVLVKFGATWCGPCLSTDKALAEYEKSSTGEVKVVILDVDVSQELSRHYRVNKIPHLFLFKDGKVIDDQIGGLNVAEIRSWIKGNEKHWKDL
jgi:thioredoxin 1